MLPPLVDDSELAESSVVEARPPTRILDRVGLAVVAAEIVVADADAVDVDALVGARFEDVDLTDSSSEGCSMMFLELQDKINHYKLQKTKKRELH